MSSTASQNRTSLVHLVYRALVEREVSVGPRVLLDLKGGSDLRAGGVSRERWDPQVSEVNRVLQARTPTCHAFLSLPR